MIFAGRQQPVLEQVDLDSTTQAAWKRLAPDHNTVLVPRIGSQEARQILDVRLRRFVEPFLTLAAIRERVEQESLFPLGSDWFQDRTQGLSEFRPRDVILWAAERWRQVRTQIHELGGPTWFDGSCPRAACPRRGALAVVPAREPTTAPRGVMVASAPALATVPRTPDRAVPGPALLADASPQTPSPPRRSSWIVETGAWSVTAVNLAALLLSVLWWPGTGPQGSSALAQKQPGAMAGSARRYIGLNRRAQAMGRCRIPRASSRTHRMNRPAECCLNPRRRLQSRHRQRTLCRARATPAVRSRQAGWRSRQPTRASRQRGGAAQSTNQHSVVVPANAPRSPAGAAAPANNIVAAKPSNSLTSAPPASGDCAGPTGQQ